LPHNPQPAPVSTILLRRRRSARALRAHVPFGQLSLASATTNQSYDAEGNLTGYSYTVPNQFTATYTVSYLKRDGYLEQATTGSSSTTGYTPATDTSLYDTLGQRIAVQQTEQLSSGTVSSKSWELEFSTRAGCTTRRRSHCTAILKPPLHAQRVRVAALQRAVASIDMQRPHGL
jgi:hypothetical protein